MKGFLHLIVPPEDFEPLTDHASALTTYTFNTHTAKHHFCKTCGIHSFYVPRSHPDKIDVNVHCLEDVGDGAFELVDFDGSAWEDNVDALRDALS